MSDRHDLRRQTREIQEALSRFERDQLADILTHVFRTYVMEGAALSPPPPAAIGDELAGLSFAQVIERLQLRLDLPELQLFDVQAGRVSVRLDGRLQALEIPTGRPEAPARGAPPPPPAQLPPASPGVERQELRPATPPPPSVMPAPAGHASSPRPEASGRPPAARATSASVASAARAAAAPAEKPAAPPPAPPKAPEKPADDNSQGGRFGLLEID